MIDTQQQYIKLNIRGEISVIVVQAQGLVTIQVNILSMYKHICLYIDSIFTWIVTRPCGAGTLGQEKRYMYIHLNTYLVM